MTLVGDEGTCTAPVQGNETVEYALKESDDERSWSLLEMEGRIDSDVNIQC